MYLQMYIRIYKLLKFMTVQIYRNSFLDGISLEISNIVASHNHTSKVKFFIQIDRYLS